MRAFWDLVLRGLVLASVHWIFLFFDVFILGDGSFNGFWWLNGV